MVGFVHPGVGIQYGIRNHAVDKIIDYRGNAVYASEPVVQGGLCALRHGLAPPRKFLRGENGTFALRVALGSGKGRGEHIRSVAEGKARHNGCAERD